MAPSDTHLNWPIVTRAHAPWQGTDMVCETGPAVGLRAVKEAVAEHIAGAEAKAALPFCRFVNRPSASHQTHERIRRRRL
jgi:hypothetical protein